MLDMRTLMITYVINSLMNTIVMAIYWSQNKKYFRGILYWVIALSMQTIGFLLLGIRGFLPDFITIVVSNFIIVLASFMMYEGFKRFVGYKAGNIHNYLLLAIYILLQYYFVFIQPSTSIRIILISIVTSLIFFQSGRLLLDNKKQSLAFFTKLTGVICYIYILVQLYRIVVELTIQTNEYFNASLFAITGQVFNQFLTIAMVFSFIIMCNNINLHNRIQSEQKVIASKERIQDLYNNAPCGYHSLDENGLFVDVNDTELEWLGYERGEVIEKIKLTDIATPPSITLFKNRFPKFIKAGFQNDLRMELITKSGAILPVIVNAKAMYDSNNNYKYSLSTIFNRTEIDKVEKELKEARKEADQANIAKSEFLSKMSHELRTPLNAIIALSGVLGNALASKIPEDEYQYIEVIHRSGNNLLELINDLLDISRIESGRIEMEIKAFNLNNVFLRLIDIMQPIASKKNIEIFWTLSDEEIIVVSDENIMIHILQNVIGNAIKFTEEGHVSISITNTDNSVIISVKDTGIGIDKANLPHIFDEFRQADQSITRRFGGTGLGLSIVKKYLDMLEGSIQVNSIPEKGSEFIIEIPLVINKI